MFLLSIFSWHLGFVHVLSTVRPCNNDIEEVLDSLETEPSGVKRIREGSIAGSQGGRAVGRSVGRPTSVSRVVCRVLCVHITKLPSAWWRAPIPLGRRVANDPHGRMPMRLERAATSLIGCQGGLFLRRQSLTELDLTALPDQTYVPRRPVPRSTRLLLQPELLNSSKSSPLETTKPQHRHQVSYALEHHRFMPCPRCVTVTGNALRNNE